METKDPEELPVSKIKSKKAIEERDDVVILFAGDSGDGMQLTGSQFTSTTAFIGNDVATFPDYPSEIRAPAGTLAGVSGFQIHFSSRHVLTSGDSLSVLVAMNPAAFKTNLPNLDPGGIVIANTDAFTPQNLSKARYETNPLEDPELLKDYQVFRVPITSLTLKACEPVEGLTAKQGERTKNFFALGLTYWLYDRPLDVTLEWIETKFKKSPAIAKANRLALTAGYYYGETTEMFARHYRIPRAKLKSGSYRHITGNEATALGGLAASYLADTPLLYASYPITPASEILQELSRFKRFGVKTIQCEDEIAAACTAVGAAFSGGLAMTGTSGPGFSLKVETIGLAVMTELPLVIVNVQRGGPSTGLPTKVEQSDLLQALYGRNGDCPCPVIAATSPTDCFYSVIEAFRIAIKYMTPVIVLTDGYLANGAEPFLLPDLDTFPKIEVKYITNPEGYAPYKRDEKTLGRPWAIPGTLGLEHRIGGLEKQHITGYVSYDPLNHQRMTELRADKIKRVIEDVPDVEIIGEKTGELLMIGWGASAGAILGATEHLQGKGYSISCIQLRHMYPLPKNLGEVLKKFDKILIPELNMGQLALHLRSQYLVNAISLSKVQGKPFKITEVIEGAERLLTKGDEVVDSWQIKKAAL